MEYTFEKQLAVNITKAFSGATQLGCTASSAEGMDLLCSTGTTCEECSLCRYLGRDSFACAHTHHYGMTEAERFGGKYIYFCQRGLTFFTSPIIGVARSEAKLTVGPFLMVERADFLECELAWLEDEQKEHAADLLEEIPYMPPERVSHLSQLLFMAVGFLNNVSVSEALREQEATELIQRQVGVYIQSVKEDHEAALYPFEKEKELLSAVGSGNQPEAERLLNEVLGIVLLMSGSSLPKIKTRLLELLVMMSRTAADHGAHMRSMLELVERSFQKICAIDSMEELCFWITRTMNEMIQEVFCIPSARHADVIHQTVQYIYSHLGEKLTVENLARRVYLSPEYFGRIFKEETGKTIQQLILEMRVKRAKELMRNPGIKLAEVALATGFRDQSHFCRVFQNVCGLPPGQYRKQR